MRRRSAGCRVQRQPRVALHKNAAVQRILSDPIFQEKFLTPSFFEPILGSADAFAGYVRAEQVKWSKIIADNKVSAE